MAKIRKYIFDLETKINNRPSKYIYILFIISVIGIIL